MSEQTRVNRPKERILSTDVEGFDPLAELALDMRSSWNHATVVAASVAAVRREGGKYEYQAHSDAFAGDPQTS